MIAGNSESSVWLTTPARGSRGAAPAAVLTQRATAALRWRVAGLPGEIKGLAASLGLPLSSLTNMIDGRSPVARAWPALGRILEYAAPIAAVEAQRTGASFGDLVRGPHGYVGNAPTSAPTPRSRLTVDRFRIYADPCCDPNGTSLFEVIEGMLGTIPKAERFAFRRLWWSADEDMRAELRLALPSFEYLLMTSSGPRIIVVATAVMETMPSKTRGRKFWRLCELRTREGVSLGIVGTCAFGRRQRGDIFLEVTGAACALGLLSALLEEFVSPYADVESIRVDEIHVALDIERPAANLVIREHVHGSRPRFATQTHYVTERGRTGASLGGKAAPFRVVAYCKTTVERGVDADRFPTKSFMPAYAEDWTCCTRVELRLRPNRLGVDDRVEGIVARGLAFWAQLDVIDLGAIVPRNEVERDLLGMLVRHGAPIREVSVEQHMKARKARYEPVKAESRATNRFEREARLWGATDAVDGILGPLLRSSSPAKATEMAAVLRDWMKELLDEASLARPYDLDVIVRSGAADLDDGLVASLEKYRHLARSKDARLLDDEAGHASAATAADPTMHVAAALVIDSGMVTFRGPYKRPKPTAIVTAREQTPAVEQAGANAITATAQGRYERERAAVGGYAATRTLTSPSKVSCSGTGSPPPSGSLSKMSDAAFDGTPSSMQKVRPYPSPLNKPMAAYSPSSGRWPSGSVSLSRLAAKSKWARVGDDASRRLGNMPNAAWNPRTAASTSASQFLQDRIVKVRLKTLNAHLDSVVERVRGAGSTRQDPCSATISGMSWQFRFSSAQLARFIPTTGIDLVGFDATRGDANALFLVEHFEDAEAAEYALANVVDVTCFLSFALPPRKAAQLDMFASTEATQAKSRR